jgi:acetyltransferase-like isoleucine patch superfamily enzyme
MMLARAKELFILKILCRNDLVRYARHLGVRVGDGCRIFGNPRVVFGTEPYLVSLGNHVTIASGTRFITHDGGVRVFRENQPNIDLFGPIRLGNNVFVGFNVLMLPGVTIGDTCVVGAGSVVTRSIPPGTVAAGCPAHPLKSVEEYWQKVGPVALHVRSLPQAEKRKAVLQHFGRSGCP